MWMGVCVRAYVCAYVLVCVSILFVCVCTFMCSCVRMCVCACMNVCMLVLICACMRVCVCVHASRDVIPVPCLLPRRVLAALPQVEPPFLLQLVQNSFLPQHQHSQGDAVPGTRTRHRQWHNTQVCTSTWSLVRV